MTHYRGRDLLLLPGLLSLARIPLAALFPVVVHAPVLALSVLAISGLTDVLDGWFARRLGQVTDVGAAIDPITDKLFVGSVVVTLLAVGELSGLQVVLLATREIGELPLVLWFAMNKKARQKLVDHPSANLPGKLATALQFAAVSLALFHSALTGALLVVTAVCGAAAAMIYWLREISAYRQLAGAKPAANGRNDHRNPG
jgi:cardiolipin synthase